MPHGQLNAIALVAPLTITLLRRRPIENKAMIEEGFGRVAMHARPLEACVGCGLACGQPRHFHVRIDGAAAGTNQVLASDH